MLVNCLQARVFLLVFTGCSVLTIVITAINQTGKIVNVCILYTANLERLSLIALIQLQVSQQR